MTLIPIQMERDNLGKVSKGAHVVPVCCMMTKHEIPRSVLKFIEERTLFKLTAYTIEVEG